MACCAALAGLIAGYFALKTRLTRRKTTTAQDPRAWFLAADDTTESR